MFDLDGVAQRWQGHSVFYKEKAAAMIAAAFVLIQDSIISRCCGSVLSAICQMASRMQSTENAQIALYQGELIIR